MTAGARQVGRVLLPAALLPIVYLVLSSLASAQYTFGQLNFLGRDVQIVRLHGAEYARADVVGQRFRVSRAGGIIRIEGMGHVLLLPLDEDQRRATTTANTVQLDTERVQAPTATLINRNLYLPVETLARGIGAEYTPGSFRLPAPELVSVASRAGKTIDRFVMDLNRDVRYQTRVTPRDVQIILPDTGGPTRAYSTRGAYLPRVSVTRTREGLVVSAPLPSAFGYRVYRVARHGSVRLILDVGPGVPTRLPALEARLRRPLIVIDPVSPASAGRLGDVTMEVARETGALLTKAGWRVRLTRSGEGRASVKDRADLARASDVFLSLTVASFPGARAEGFRVFEGNGESHAEIVNGVRETGKGDGLLRLAVGDAGDSRRLSQLLTGELKALDVKTQTARVGHAHLLGEAPHAALLVELGWVQSDVDTARLGNAARRSSLAVALARSVATFLSSRAGGGL